MKRSIVACSLAVLAALAVPTAFAQSSAKPAGSGAAPAAAAPTSTAAPAAGSARPTSAAPAGTTAAPATGTPPATTTPTTAAPAPATAPAGTPPATAGAAAPTQPLDGSTYVVRLRDLEQRVDELKEQIRRSHTRLSLLSDTILSGGVGGARAEISFKNELSNAFHLTGATFVLDGAVQYNKQDDTGALADQKQIPIFSGSIPPGDHTLQVVLKLRGHGYGVFSYLRGYKFNVPATHSFTVSEGKAIKLEAIVWEKGDVTTPLEERPAIRWRQTLGSTTDEGKPDAAPAAVPVKAGASGNVSVGGGAK
ncbi:MAG TPA: hypothetical protein VGK73_15775 [Polyangiaceae bacterium]